MNGLPAEWHQTTGHYPIGTATGMRCEKDQEPWPCEARRAAAVAYEIGLLSRDKAAMRDNPGCEKGGPSYA